MIRQWLELRKERKAMRALDKEQKNAEALRVQCLGFAQYLENDSAEDLIKNAERIQSYIVEGK